MESVYSAMADKLRYKMDVVAAKNQRLDLEKLIEECHRIELSVVRG